MAVEVECSGPVHPLSTKNHCANVSDIELTEAFLARIGGWQAVKQARALLEQGSVLSSAWAPPILRGVVQSGSSSLRSGLVIKGAVDIENMCPCRESREWGMICAHSVAVGLHHLQRTSPPKAEPRPAAPPPAQAAPPKAFDAVRRLPRAQPAADGEAVQLFLILPPNFPQAITRGKAMLYIEAGWKKGRTPLDQLPLDVAFNFSPEDLRLLDQLEVITGGEPAAMIQVGSDQFTALLEASLDHPRVTLGKAQPIRIRAESPRWPLRAGVDPSGEVVVKITSLPPNLTFIPGRKPWVFDGREFRPVALPESCRELLQKPLRIPRSRVPQFFGQDWPVLEQSCEIEPGFDPGRFVFETLAPRFRLFLEGGLATLRARLQAIYGGQALVVGPAADAGGFWIPDPENPFRYSTRDLQAEKNALHRILKYGFIGPDKEGWCQVTGESQVLNFFAREFGRLEKEWEVSLEERLERSKNKNLERVEPKVQITSSGVQWFDFTLDLSASDGQRFSPADIQRLLLSGQSHTRLRNGKIALIDTGAVEELQEVLVDSAPEQNGQSYRLSNAQAAYLAETLRDQPGIKVLAPPAWHQRISRQQGGLVLECPPLLDLDPVLRPYQKEGAAWMRFLRENFFGGILADEMGLGKTLQALAFLRWARAQKSPAERRPHLVVCPTSLVFNWVAEAEKFTPDLRVMALSGPQRQRLFAEIPNHDLVVTSYSLVRRDLDRYRAEEFDTLVLDEAQHIKNRQTRNAHAVKSIRAGHRLVLTGTPLENSVLDLWSIFDFLMPGYLGSSADFRERYELPIVRDRDKHAQTRLARRVRPFLLRRLKKEVAAELPEKIEQVTFCEMTEEQGVVYREILEASRREVLAAVGEQGMAKSRMVILTALLRLRQICCDLRLLNLPRVAPENASAKLDLFGELLEEVIDGGHRVLVFSQFVKMLHLIRDRLSAEGIEFCYLDGSTSNRAEVVAKFQGSRTIPVFLISLKAGGVGLNLTAADTVIHFDPWWNPAVEQQATDRAHRIGQTNVVTSYKLIARGTIEEKILQLQTRKRAMLEGMLGDEEALAQSLSWEEIQELLG
jgi:SNF2 family DNA or RNA helicase